MSGDAANGDKSSTTEQSKLDSTEELDDEITDAMLGGLRRGMITIRNNAKETLEKCKTDELRNEMEDLLKSSTIKLLRSEKSYLETAKIVAQVVDEISSDFEEDDVDKESVGAKDSLSNSCDTVVPDADSPIYIFRPTFANSNSILNVAKRMATMFTDRIKDFEDSLTEAHLENHPKYKALQTQIDLAEVLLEKDTLMISEDGDGKLDSTDPQFDSIKYDPEELHIDFSVLPSVDPISRKPIQTALRNKYCNHIFEEMSIVEHIAVNSDATCPMHGCLNNRKLEFSHFVFDPILNNHIHQKHCM